MPDDNDGLDDPNFNPLKTLNVLRDAIRKVGAKHGLAEVQSVVSLAGEGGTFHAIFVLDDTWGPKLDDGFDELMEGAAKAERDAAQAAAVEQSRSRMEQLRQELEDPSKGLGFD